jgi:hypothetical protein
LWSQKLRKWVSGQIATEGCDVSIDLIREDPDLGIPTMKTGDLWLEFI